MRLNINLASKPYLDVRRVLIRWGVPLLLLAACTVGLVWSALTSWQETHRVEAKMAGVRSQIAALDKQHDAAVALLRQPRNAPVIEESKFLNGLIARKSFSWTRVFMQLEQIMPPRLHVNSITPELEPETNTVQVHLQVGGTSRDAALELVKRLEQSSSFRDAAIVEERTPQKEMGETESKDTVEFSLTAVYVPQPAPTAEPKAGADKSTETARNAVPDRRLAALRRENRGGQR